MRRTLAFILAAITVAACGGPGPYYAEERFGADTVHRHAFAVPAEMLCDAARAVLLGDGYVVARAEPDTPLSLAGTKEFKGEENRHALLQVYTTCRPAARGSMLYATAVESHFDVKRTKEKTSIGVPLVSPLSVTSASESQAEIKTAGETVEDRRFYERFYDAVARELGVR